MKNLFLLLILLSTALNAQNNSTFFDKANDFFNKNVQNNKVEYDDIKKNQTDLNELVKLISSFDFDSETVSGQKAFLINAYNISVIKGIINRFPVKSPLDISGFFDKLKYEIAGKKMTLNDIENKMIRYKYKDVRFHFALVCGANGCPPILNKAYLPATVESQLTSQTRLAVNNPNFTKVNEDSKTVKLSQLFEWYKDDFLTKGTSYLDFLNKYRTDKIPESFKISIYTYDWNLNSSK